MIKVVVTTYCPEPGHPRGEYLPKVLYSLHKNLKSPEQLLHVIANDGDPLEKHVWAYRPNGFHMLPIGGSRVGIGGSLNRALSHVQPDDLWLYTTDDWYLDQKLDLAQAVRLIREGGYDYVRLGPPHPNIRCTITFQQGLGWWLHFNDPQVTSYAFATRPFLASRAFYDKVGPFKDQCDAYVCERDYGDRVNAALAIKMAEVVSGSLEGHWEHIGEVEVGDKFP